MLIQQAISQDVMTTILTLRKISISVILQAISIFKLGKLLSLASFSTNLLIDKIVSILVL